MRRLLIRENELYEEHEGSIGKGEETEGLVDYGGLWITAHFMLSFFFLDV